MALPSIQDVRSSFSDSPPQLLADALALLFEPSSILIDELVPQIAATDAGELQSCSNLIDRAIDIVLQWDWGKQAEFVGGHPRIGEVKGLSALSAAEQSNAVVPTPPEVLHRLEILNAVYEQRYPGLVYITFVNGRSRAAIAEEMERKLAAEGVLPSMKPDQITPRGVPSEEWCAEVARAVQDVGKIAKSRLEKLGVH